MPELSNSKYVLFYRLTGEPVNTAHLVLLRSIAAAAEHLKDIPNVQWCSLCNDEYFEVRDHHSLI